jgi:hypothetical protein
MLHVGSRRDVMAAADTAAAGRGVTFVEVYLKLCAERRLEPYFPLVGGASDGALDVDAEFIVDEAWVLFASALRAATAASYRRIRVAVGDNFGPRHPPKQSRRQVPFETLAAQRAPRPVPESMVGKLIQGLAHQSALSMQTLTELRIVGVPAGPLGAAKIAAGVSAAVHLTVFQLDGAYITNAGLAHLVAPLRRLPQLTTVSLRHAGLTSGAAEDVGKLVSGCTSSRPWEDTLRRGGGGGLGAPVSLTYLSIADNAVADAVVTSIIRQEAARRCLRHLDLGGTGVASGALDTLLDAMVSQRASLTHVDLSRTPAARGLVDADLAADGVEVWMGADGANCVLHRQRSEERRPVGSQSAAVRRRSPPNGSAAAPTAARGRGVPPPAVTIGVTDPDYFSLTSQSPVLGGMPDAVMSGPQSAAAARPSTAGTGRQSRSVSPLANTVDSAMLTRTHREPTPFVQQPLSASGDVMNGPLAYGAEHQSLPQMQLLPKSIVGGPQASALPTQRELMLEAALLTYQRRVMELEAMLGANAWEHTTRSSLAVPRQAQDFAAVLRARRAALSPSRKADPRGDVGGHEDASAAPVSLDALSGEDAVAMPERDTPLAEAVPAGVDDQLAASIGSEMARQPIAIMRGSDPLLSHGSVAAAVREEIDAVLDANENDKQELIASVAEYITAALSSLQDSADVNAMRLEARLAEQAEVVAKLEARLGEMADAAKRSALATSAAPAPAATPRIIVIPRNLDDEDREQSQTAAALHRCIDKILVRMQESLGVTPPVPESIAAKKPMSTAAAAAPASAAIASSVTNDDVRQRLSKLGW